MTVIFQLSIRSVRPKKLLTGYSARAEATGANSNGLRSAVNNSLNLANVGLPSSVGMTVGVRYSLTENNALSANFTLCHVLYQTFLNIFELSFDLSRNERPLSHDVLLRDYGISHDYIEQTITHRMVIIKTSPIIPQTKEKCNRFSEKSFNFFEKLSIKISDCDKIAIFQSIVAVDSTTTKAFC